MLHAAHRDDSVFLFLFQHALSFSQYVFLGLVQLSKRIQSIAHVQPAIRRFRGSLCEAPAAHVWASPVLLVLSLFGDRVSTFLVASWRNEFLRRMDVSVRNFIVQLVFDELLYHQLVLRRRLVSHWLADRISFEI